MQARRTGRIGHDPAWHGPAASRGRGRSVFGDESTRVDLELRCRQGGGQPLIMPTIPRRKATKRLVHINAIASLATVAPTTTSAENRNPHSHQLWPAGSCMRGFRTPAGTRNPSPSRTFRQTLPSAESGRRSRALARSRTRRLGGPLLKSPQCWQVGTEFGGVNFQTRHKGRTANEQWS